MSDRYETARTVFLLATNLLAAVEDDEPIAQALFEIATRHAFWLKQIDSAWYETWRAMDGQRTTASILYGQVAERLAEASA